MRGRTVYLLGVVLGALTCAAACSEALDLTPDLEVGPDPATRRTPPSKEAPASEPLTSVEVDAEALPSPVPDTDGGFTSASDGGGGRTVDAALDAPDAAEASAANGPAYEPRCGGFLAADREQENNDTLAKANVLDDIVCAGLNSASDVDWFVVDTNRGLSFTFDPDDDAFANVTTPSGMTASSYGPALYGSGENGRYVIEVHSPTHRTQTYLLVRH